MIDQIYAVRQLAPSLMVDPDNPGPLSSKLLKAIESASVLRNKMDHLNSNIKNLTCTKGQRSALFGSLSYFITDNPPSSHGFSIILQTGLVHGQESMVFVNPAGREFIPPADLFELTAFGITVPLGPPLVAFAEWLNATTADLEAEIMSHVKKLTAETEYTEEHLMQHAGGGYTIALAIQFEGKPEPVAAHEEVRLPKTARILQQT